MFKQEYDECRSRKEQIKLLLEEMQEQDNGRKGVTVEEVKKDIEKAIAELQNAGFYTLRHIFKQYIERVEISKNEVRVTFKVALASSDFKAAKYTFSRTWDRDMLKNYVA